MSTLEELKGFEELELYIVLGLAIFIIWFIFNTIAYYKGEKRKVKQLHRFAKEGEVEAQHRLARRYHKGNMVKKSCTKAAFWYQKAAFSGDKDARGYLEKFSKKDPKIKKC